MDERALTLHRSAAKSHEVTALRASPDRIHLAVGYADGVVEIFDLTQPGADVEQSICSLALHKSAISILRYDEHGLRLLSGSLDTDLVVVDVVEQAGQQRLTGHNAAITDGHFYDRCNNELIVVSSSKDTQIKFWNVETQICFKTIVDNRTEVWGLAFARDLMVAGCGESNLSVYRLSNRNKSSEVPTTIEGFCVDDDVSFSSLVVTNCGVIQRAGKGRCVNLVVDKSEKVLSCNGTNPVIENFYICSHEEANQRLAKRIKKAKKAQKNRPNTVEGDEKLAEGNEDATPVDCVRSLSDDIVRLPVIRCQQKIKSLDMLYGKHNNVLRVLITLANNSIRLFSMDLPALESKIKPNDMETNCKELRSITRHGHQSEVRTVCFTSDSLAIGSGAGESFKIWNRERQQCLRTTTTDYILCSTFVTGDRYVLLGLKSGKLLIVDVGLGEIVEEIAAHEKELWSIVPTPDKRGCITGSSDMTVKVWSYALIDSMANNQSESLNEKVKGKEKAARKQKNTLDEEVEREQLEEIEIEKKVLSLLHNNTLKLKEAALCVQVSPNMKYLAVGLMDATVQVFFLDTFKFFLSLYGHKMPVLCLDISYDSTLIVSGSADRNVKIWGLDFGDCHRSLFAHDDSVMAVQFIPKTHMFFTCGKDGEIKQWDADNFEKILTLPGHLGEAYGLAVSPNGEFLVSCGSDRTLRLYQRTDELLVLEDVQEEEREQMENQQLATGEDHTVPLLPGMKLASRKTVGSEKAAESILECLEICKQVETEIMTQMCASDPSMAQMLSGKLLPDPYLHPLMRALGVHSTTNFLIITLERIRTSDMEEALLVLPFTNVCELLERMPAALTHRNDVVELLSRVVTFLFKIHMKPLSRAHHMKPMLKKLVDLLKDEVKRLRDDIGYNLHSLALIQNELEEREGVELFREAVVQSRKSDKKKREHERQLKRLLIQMS